VHVFIFICDLVWRENFYWGLWLGSSYWEPGTLADFWEWYVTSHWHVPQQHLRCPKNV